MSIVCNASYDQMVKRWNAIPRRSDIAQAVAAERARVYEACAEVAQGKMMMLTLQNDSVTVWNTACMLIHDSIRARAAQESEGEKK